jgi:hypothetical protein
MLQKPAVANMGILVVMMATLMSMISGIVASRVNRPMTRSIPQTISITPTKGAKNCGAGMPIFRKRPADVQRHAAGKLK